MRGARFFSTVVITATVVASVARADTVVIPPPPPLPSSSVPSSSASAGLIGVTIFVGVVGAICLVDFLRKVTGNKPWVDPTIGEPHLKKN